jgi:2-C-methyl-D-erythritol 2,4-cyclodiphosphate synthase
MEITLRIGIGYDIHRLREGRKLILGGVEIPYIKGLEGYSDADVLLHSICDAILGASGMGDIGRHFPDTDPRWCGISSIELLKKTLSMVREHNFDINNVDSVVIAEEPKISPFVEKMKSVISGALNIEKEKVNIKASTNEGVGSIGRGEAIACYSVVMLN